MYFILHTSYFILYTEPAAPSEGHILGAGEGRERSKQLYPLVLRESRRSKGVCYQVGQRGGGVR